MAQVGDKIEGINQIKYSPVRGQRKNTHFMDGH